MKKSKNSIVFILVFVLCLSLVGCTSKEIPTVEPVIEQSESEIKTEEIEEPIEEVEDIEPEEVDNTAILYVTLDEGNSYNEVEVESKDAITPEFLIKEISSITGWNLDLADAVTSGKGGMTVSFAKTSAIYVGPPEPQVEEYYVFDTHQLCTSIFSSIKYTLQHNFVNFELGGDPESLDIYFCAEGDTELFIESIDGIVPMTEPYTGIVYNTEDVTAMLYYPDDELMEMLQVECYKNIHDQKELYAAWEEGAKLDTDTQVLSFYDNTLDLSNEFSVFIGNFGSSGEIMYIEGLAKTFKEYYGISELYLTIEGEVLETGHNIYDYAL